MKDTPTKNPVLTSPWKIGVLVALLLVVVGFGGGYYVVRVYDIELEWLQGNLGQWEVDSYVFFREMYPLVAGILVLSVISYLVVASAVRRYRHFLDSGQDYKKMIQLADSIDDLTNPAQIAKLKQYPRLQAILRNYGDQIRAISKQLTEQQSQSDHRPVDLEMEIDSLLQGESTQDSLVEDRWWTPLYRKIESRLQDDQRVINAMKMKVHEGKTALGRVALSTGRIVEQISGTSEEYPEILSAVNELNSVVEMSEGKTGSKKQKSAKSDKGMLKAIVGEMENTLHKLEDGGKVLNEFSEENNGLALNIALMAARGEASEHDLAQFAEKVRSTADRFNKLSRTFASMAQGLLGTCYTLKEKLEVEYGAESNRSGVDRQMINGISEKIEERCNRLQERLCYIGNEIHDVQELLNKSIRSIAIEEGASAEAIDEKRSPETEESETADGGIAAEQDEEGSELVIDRGGHWGDDSELGDDLVSFGKMETVERVPGGAERQTVIDSETDRQPEAEDEVKPEHGKQRMAEKRAGKRSEKQVREEVREVQEVDATEDLSEDETEEKEYVISIEDAAAEIEASFEAEQHHASIVDDEGGASEIREEAVEHEWDDATMKKWVKIDIEKDEPVDVAEPEEVVIREAADVASEDLLAHEEPLNSDGEAAEAPRMERAQGGEVDEEDPIYDLYELGAVEYMEEPLVKG